MSTATLGFTKYFGRIQDTRRCPRHLLIDMIGIAICATIAGANDWQQIVEFGQTRHEWLAQFFALPNGIPSHDTFERVFDRIDPASFNAAFSEWMFILADSLGIKHIAIDGKTMRGSGSAAKGIKALHIVSAWAVENQLSLGQVAVDAKSNEITAIPKLLELLEIKGALITIDAMGCQKAIAETIIDGGGDYILTVKDNQENLLNDIQTAFMDAADCDFKGLDFSTYETTTKGHGRLEYRSYTVLHCTDGIRDLDLWKGLTTIGICYSERTVNGKTTEETRYFIGSKDASARYYGKGLRNHWGIENSLHWQLDVTFREDDNRERSRNAGENLATIRKIALALLKQDPSKGSIACKRLRAAYDENFICQVVQNCVNL